MKEQISQNKELIFVIIIILVIMGTYYYYLFREYSKNEEALKNNKITPQCPDYWKAEGNNICKNVFNIGRCNLGNHDSMDFSDKLYAEDINKCKWSKFCEASWEGIDNLCV